MQPCSRCQGEGEETYEEDGRIITDVCYHCAGSGKVDDDTAFHDRLYSVASSIAYSQESEYRKACNNDPDGDGYDLGAYENGMMPSDYFRSRVWDRTYDIAEKLSEMSQADQEFLVAWNEYSSEPIPEPAVIQFKPYQQLVGECLEILESFDNDIPF
jgi:hypothetical protein